MIVVNFEQRFSSIDDLPDNNCCDLDWVCIDVIDFEFCRFKVANSERNFLLLIQWVNQKVEPFFLNSSGVLSEKLQGLSLIWIDDKVTVPLQEPKYSQCQLKKASKEGGDWMNIGNGQNKYKSGYCKPVDGNSKKTVDCGFLYIFKHDFIITGCNLLGWGCCLHTGSCCAIIVIS